MKDQINTIRAALELATPHYQADTERFKQALTALDQIEKMAGEPYGTVTVVRNPGCVDMHYFYRHPEPPYLDNAAECHTLYRASPVAQQPQQVKALRAPTKTEWGAGMVCIDIELDKDTTATVFFDREDTTKVEQRFNVGVKNV